MVAANGAALAISYQLVTSGDICAVGLFKSVTLSFAWGGLCAVLAAAVNFLLGLYVTAVTTAHSETFAAEVYNEQFLEKFAAEPSAFRQTFIDGIAEAEKKRKTTFALLNWGFVGSLLVAVLVVASFVFLALGVLKPVGQPEALRPCVQIHATPLPAPSSTPAP